LEISSLYWSRNLKEYLKKEKKRLKKVKIEKAKARKKYTGMR